MAVKQKAHGTETFIHLIQTMLVDVVRDKKVGKNYDEI